MESSSTWSLFQLQTQGKTLGFMQACPSLNVSSVLIIFDIYRTNSVIHNSNPAFRALYFEVFWNVTLCRLVLRNLVLPLSW